jgi:predicted dehydrogenase
MAQDNYILVGAGAIAEQLYLKYFQSAAYGLWVCENNPRRAAELAKKFPGIHFTTEDFDVITAKQEFKAGFICLPNHLHAAFIRKFREKNIPVLVEKPVVASAADFSVLDEGGIIYVAHLRRFFDSSLFLRKLVQTGIFGAVKRVEVSDGGVFSWRLQSDYLLSREKSGGGVLMDSGIHWVDLLISVLGDIKTVHYDDNNRGGVESECELSFSFENGSGEMRFSRIRPVKRFIRFEFENAMYFHSLDQPDHATITMKDFEGLKFQHRLEDNLQKAFASQMEAFLSVLNGKSSQALLPDAEEAMKSVRFIHQCYESQS